MKYEKPEIRTIQGAEILESLGPVSAGSGREGLSFLPVFDRHSVNASWQRPQ